MSIGTDWTTTRSHSLVLAVRHLRFFLPNNTAGHTKCRRIKYITVLLSFHKDAPVTTTEATKFCTSLGQVRFLIVSLLIPQIFGSFREITQLMWLYFFQFLAPGEKVKYKRLELSEVIHLSYFLRGRWLEVCKERCLSFSVLTIFRAETIRRGQLPWFCSFA